jgi:hypothetical protein
MTVSRLKGREKSFPNVIDVGLMTEAGRLFDRSAGKRIYELITEKLKDLPGDSTLLLDFSGVQQAGHSALKEIFAIFGLRRVLAPAGKHLIFLVDLENEEFVELIEILARDLGHLIPVINKTGSWHVFGKLTKAESDTMRAVLECEQITSKQLKERLQILNVAASNRLRFLFDRGLVRREQRTIPGRGGREFVYKPLIPIKRRK